MKALNILTHEHMIIQKMLNNLEHLSNNLNENQLKFFDEIIDFFKTFTDKTHHGKEEAVLFEKLKKKNIDDDLKKIMNELIEEHKISRNYVKDLKIKSDLKNINEIKFLLSKMIKFLKKHIEKENEIFFPKSFDYFSEKEKEEILELFLNVDKDVLNEKYLSLVEALSKKINK
jgi:hemerythrin-like domain-containing protein